MLITRFLSADGVGEVVDLMPVCEGKATDRHRIVRLVRVVRGTMEFTLDCQPRFDYGRAPHKLQVLDGGARFETADLHLTALHLRKGHDLGGVRPGHPLADHGSTPSTTSSWPTAWSTATTPRPP